MSSEPKPDKPQSITPAPTGDGDDGSSGEGFAGLGLAEPILEAVQSLGYEVPYPIQVASIPPLLAGRDILGQAQTGTGKTAAFALPLLSRLDMTKVAPQILVLTPTRELAIQVAEAMQSYARQLPGFHVVPIYGGAHIGGQLKQLHRRVHVVVGTPGRLLDHLRRKTLRLDGLSAVVIDEADEMLRMGFIEEVQGILDHTPEKKQVALFSATFPAAVRKISERYLKDPVEVRIVTKTSTVSTTSQRYWRVSGAHKLDALTRILEVEEFDAMLIFVRTRTSTGELAEKLEARGFTAAALSGDMSQVQRERTIERLRSGALDIVVATDVAARGLDVDRLSHVVNYDIPFDVEAYIHRIGRTGRAGRIGAAITFIAPRERRMLEAIQRATRQPMEPMRLPTREDVTDRRVARFKQLLNDAIESQDLTFFADVIAGYQRDHAVDLDRIAAGLAYLVQHERPLQPPPEEFRPLPVDRAKKQTPAEARRAKARVESGVSRPVPSPAGFPPSTPPSKPRPAERPSATALQATAPQVTAPQATAPQATAPQATAPQATAPRATAPKAASRAARPVGEGAADGRVRAARPNKAPTRPEMGMERFRIEVGSAHGVEARNIVGAIANEADLDAEFIGPIEIHEAHAFVDLPEGMPKALYKHLRKVWVGGRQLQLSRTKITAGVDEDREPRRGPRGPRDDRRTPASRRPTDHKPRPASARKKTAGKRKP